MIIGVNGNLIDTTKIYQITEIKSAASHIRIDGQWYDLLSYYYFSLLTLKEKENDVLIRLEKKEFNSIEEYEKELENILQKITKLRQDVVNVWSNNQSQIPQFNF